MLTKLPAMMEASTSNLNPLDYIKKIKFRENNPHQVNNSGCLHPLKAIIVYCWMDFSEQYPIAVEDGDMICHEKSLSHKTYER